MSDLSRPAPQHLPRPRRRRRALPALLAGAVAAALGTAVVQPASAAPPPGAAALPAAVPAAGAAPAWLRSLRSTETVHVRGGALASDAPDAALSLRPDGAAGETLGQRLLRQQRAAATAAARAVARAAAGQAAPPRLTTSEDEPLAVRGANDTLATAETVTRFGTGAGLVNAVDLTGNQAAGPQPRYTALPPNTEDDGDLDRARVTGVSNRRPGFRTTGTLGDAPLDDEGNRPGDVDIWAVDLTAGQLFSSRLAVTPSSSDPDRPMFFDLVLLDRNGNFAGFAQQNRDGLHPVLTVPVPVSGRYYVLAIGSTVIDLGTGQTWQSTGDYSVRIGVRAGDVDTYAVRLAAGDVLGATVRGGAGLVSAYDRTGTLLMGSPGDASGIYPLTSPLPGGGNATLDVVAPRAGTYYVAVGGGDGPYSATFEAYRPGGTGKVAQTIFLDYDGARVNTGIWGGRGVSTLSPLSAFLADWGLRASDRVALGRAIKAEVQENLVADLRASGLSDSVAVRVVTSDESPDLFGQPGVTRVVVGGTIEESGVPTIGIAQSIDPGNFDREETALVLLDVLSDTRGRYRTASLNWWMRPASDRLAFVAQAVGNVTAHEAGHMIGNWHTDNTNGRASLMDAGGFGFGKLFGVGPDLVGGTADDTDTDFVADAFDPFEGFSGTENTVAKSTWALSR